MQYNQTEFHCSGAIAPAAAAAVAAVPGTHSATLSLFIFYLNQPLIRNSHSWMSTILLNYCIQHERTSVSNRH